jgi:hypothetical protein
VHNPLQDDGDDDGVGDLCDNCEFTANPANTVPFDCNGDSDTLDPGEAVGEQCDVDADGEGDACEPVEIQLVTTGTPAAPAWDLKLRCGAFDVTDVNAAIVLPASATADTSCSGPPYPHGCLTLASGSLGSGYGVSGPGLTTPTGVRDDAIYFSAVGLGTPPDNPLCAALDPPVLLGTLSAGAIGGTELAAAALAEEGVGTPGFGLSLAEAGAGPIPDMKVRLTNGVPLPILDLELGPAVVTSGGTRWEVLLKNATAEFHRVAFGLIAPFGTATGDMRWLGCESTATPPGARALVSGERSCTGGTGFGTTVNAAKSWTVGPQAGAPGAQLDHTLYVVLEGNRASLATLDTLNPENAQGAIVLGSVELDGNPELEPALSVDGVNAIDDLFNTGTPVPPLEEADYATPDPTQLKLVGAFNPADDVDGDGVQDLGDNCPFAPNADQQNNGSFLSAVPDSDSLGDACQCAESTGDGAVMDPADFEEIRDSLSGKIVVPEVAAEIEERCSVAGTTECNMRDLVFLKLAIDAGPGVGEVESRCDAALSPAR